MLLHRGRGHRMILDVRRDDDWGDLFQAMHAVLLAPCEELGDGLRIGSPRVPIPDIGSEELDEAPGGGFAGPPDRGREVLKPGTRKIAIRDRNETGHAHGAWNPRRWKSNSSG